MDENRLKKFGRFLKALAEDETVEVKTIAQVAGDLSLNDAWISEGEDVVPKSGVGASLVRLVDRLGPKIGTVLFSRK